MSNKVFVGGLSWNTTEDTLRQVMDRFGGIEELKIVTDRETGRSRGFGFVSFADKAAAQACIAEINGTELDGRTIKVSEAEDKPRSNDRGGGGHRGDYGGGGGGRGGGGGGRGGRGGGGGGGGRDRW